MKPHPPTAEASDPASTAFRERRVVQIISISLLGFGVSALTELLMKRWENQLIYLSVSLLLVGMLWLVRHGRLNLATNALLATLTGMVTLLMVRNGGVRDPALLAYPGILVFASLLGGRRMYLGLVVFMFSVLAVIVTGNMQGWLVSTRPAVGLNTFVDLGIVLLVVAFAVWQMANDLQRAMTRLEAEKRRIEFMANHDPLTSLPNRLLVRERFNHAVALARRKQCASAVMCFDLDNFKNVNDSLGHAAGDLLLQQVGVRVSSLLRASDTLSRQGGDEFVILLDELADADAAATIACKVQELLAQPFQVLGSEVLISCSLGVALYPDDGQEFDELLKKADIAMYRAKEEGRNAFRFFDAQMNATVVEHVQLIAGMRNALQRGEFLLHYQPQIDLASQAIVGVEALIRWRHPSLGLVPPARFIPLAEQSGLIVEIGAWVLQQACEQASQWRRQGLGELVMAVNVSLMQFRRGDIERVVANALDASGLPAACLELEITETLLVQDVSNFSDMLKRLKQLGVRLAIDDFGTGYSNLGYLKKFEVDRLKIDQSFVRRLLESPQDEAIVRAILQIAGSLHLATTAEGIEDPATLGLLRRLGCQQGQGFLWSPAVPAEQFVAMLGASSAAANQAIGHDAALFQAQGI